MGTNRLSAGFAAGVVLSSLVVLRAAPLAALSLVQDQSDLDSTSTFNISGFLPAEDLNFPVRTRIDTLTVWLTDNVANDNGVLDGFSGKLSWALFGDSGAPGGPGILLRSGTDTTPTLSDSGLQSSSGHDIVRAQIDFDGRTAVGPGRVWLVIHEGAWGSVDDGSTIYCLESLTVRGLSGRMTVNQANPSPGDWFVAIHDTALVVEGDPSDWYEDVDVGGEAIGISSFVSADDFFLPATTTLDSLDVWLTDNLTPNGQLNNYSGTLSWGLFSDGGGEPGTLVASGMDVNVGALNVLPSASLGDIGRVRIQLRPRPTLASGTWWLALHEGGWGTTGDGSQVYWMQGVGLHISQALLAAAATEPNCGQGFTSPGDTSFVLFQDSIFASGFDAGTTCAWSSTVTSVAGSTCS
ncbi:MAG: hypothetical protein ABI639_10285 [Thermoanaerobaculia bacterium]